MAYQATIAQHNVAYVGKMLCSEGGAHILNFLMEEDMDNGMIVAQGDFIERDLYKAVKGSGTELTVRALEPSGMYLLEVTKEADEFMLMQVPIANAGYETREYTDDAIYYNGVGEVVRGRELTKFDTVLVNEKNIAGEVKVGAKVTVVAGKLTIPVVSEGGNPNV